MEHFREAFGPLVLHVHLTAPEEVLQRRYELRLATAGEATPYAAAIQHENERASRSLSEFADLVLDTSTLTPLELAQLIAHAAQPRL